jgi:uncharacterized protein (TIGR00266 family)
VKFGIEGNPDYGQLNVALEPNERFVGEGGSMAWMTTGMNVKARMLGGVVKAVVRRMVAKESPFVGEYSHPRGDTVAFSPSTPGAVMRRTLSGDSFILTGGAFMACTPGVKLKTRFGGLKALFSGEGAFVIECNGEGELFYNAYGAIVEKQVEGGFTVDTGHVVAWEPSLNYSLRGMGNLKSTLLSGEGLALNFSGTGKVYLQTRTMSGMAEWLASFSVG